MKLSKFTYILRIDKIQRTAYCLKDSAFIGKTFRLEQEDAFCSSRKEVPAGRGMEAGLEAEENSHQFSTLLYRRNQSAK